MMQCDPNYVMIAMIAMIAILNCFLLPSIFPNLQQLINSNSLLQQSSTVQITYKTQFFFLDNSLCQIQNDLQ